MLLFGSPLESRWPGVGSPGCGTVKTFLEEDATLLKLPIGVFRASSSSWCCCGMELCVLHSFSSHRMSCNCFRHFLRLEWNIIEVSRNLRYFLLEVDLCIRVLFRLNRSTVYQTIAGDGNVNFRGGVCSATVSIPGGCFPYCPTVVFQCSFLGAGFCCCCGPLMQPCCGEFCWWTFCRVIIVITNCRCKETTKVMLSGEGIFIEIEFYIIRNFTERTLTCSHHHVILLRHDFCRY